MKILGVETSCDETAAAVVENGTKVLSNVVASSAEMHAKTGGIIPEQAARSQVISIIPVIDEALRNADLTERDIDAIAVTYGPGLIGSLLVGVETAKTLSYVWGKTLIPVNHLVAHIYANWINGIPRPENQHHVPKFPAIALVVSGGHTDLVLMKDHGNISGLGGTLDDAAGEAFDKTARLLGLSYPGGPSISREAEKYLKSYPNVKLNLLPRPVINEDNFDWSFSGLKTAVLREIGGTKLSKQAVNRFAAEIQEAIVDVLVQKTLKAVDKHKPASLLISGGVAANKRLRNKLEHQLNQKNTDVQLFVPEPKLCTDNAVVIASAAFFYQEKIALKEVCPNPELTITT